MNTQVSIGQVKRDISELVNRVAFGGERITLTSRGKPKAVLVSLEDYERLLKTDNRTIEINKWLSDTKSLSSRIEDRHGEPIDVDALLEVDRNELEDR